MGHAASAHMSLRDLRHFFAVGAVVLGESLAMMGDILGRTRVKTTARVSHLATEAHMGKAGRAVESHGPGSRLNEAVKMA